MKKRLIKKLTLNKQTVADLRAEEKTNIKAGAPVTYYCTGITCAIPTGCVPADPTECSSPSLSEAPWPCPC